MLKVSFNIPETKWTVGIELAASFGFQFMSIEAVSKINRYIHRAGRVQYSTLSLVHVDHGVCHFEKTWPTVTFEGFYMYDRLYDDLGRDY